MKAKNWSNYKFDFEKAKQVLDRCDDFADGETSVAECINLTFQDLKIEDDEFFDMCCVLEQAKRTFAELGGFHPHEVMTMQKNGSYNAVCDFLQFTGG